MQKLIFICLFFLGWNYVNSQELNCNVTVVSSQISGSNKQVFSTLEKAVSDFMNNNKWTKIAYKKQEKVQCALIINITEQSGSNDFSGSIQLQVVRPVFDSTYQTPILNYKDDDVSFTYEEFQPLLYNETNYESNLTSLLSFYAYVILGFDSDSFAEKGGDKYFKKAESIVAIAQQGGKKGWSSLSGKKSRFGLIDQMLDNAFSVYRNMLYNYHIKGLDLMFKDKELAKKNMAKSIISLRSIYSSRPSSLLLRLFSDTKTEEIKSVFKDGPKIDTVDLKEMLMRFIPANNESWNAIK